MARLDSVPSFSHDPEEEADHPTTEHQDAGSEDDDDDAGFEFAFAPPLAAAASSSSRAAAADDLFANGRILPAYPPVFFERRRLSRSLRHDDGPQDAAPQQAASTAPPSPDTYCAWAPAARERERVDDLFPKSASTGEARRSGSSWRLRDLLGGGRSHSDGKEKFVFLHHPGPGGDDDESASSAAQSKKPSAPALSAPLKQQQKQSKEKNKKSKKPGGAVTTEMDMATAHKLFYSKQGAGGDRRQQQQHSYLPYRTGIVGFFATAHALGGRSHHHPY